MLNSNFTFTNVNESDVNIALYDIDPSTYAQLSDEPAVYKMSNTTAGVDTPEIITYQCGKLNRVPLSAEMQTAATQSSAGVQYGVKVEELLRVTNEEESVITDLPVSVCITFKHARNAMISEAQLIQVLGRALGALYKADGTSRLSDMMRFCIKPR